MDGWCNAFCLFFWFCVCVLRAAFTGMCAHNEAGFLTSLPFCCKVSLGMTTLEKLEITFQMFAFLCVLIEWWALWEMCHEAGLCVELFKLISVALPFLLIDYMCNKHSKHSDEWLCLLGMILDSAECEAGSEWLWNAFQASTQVDMPCAIAVGRYHPLAILYMAYYVFPPNIKIRSGCPGLATFYLKGVQSKQTH